MPHNAPLKEIILLPRSLEISSTIEILRVTRQVKDLIQVTGKDALKASDGWWDQIAESHVGGRLDMVWEA